MTEEKKTVKYRTLSPNAQAERIMSGKLFLYEMRMRFTADGGLKSLDDFMSAMGDTGKFSAKKIVTLHMEQTVPFIPDDDILAKYAEALRSSYSNGDIVLREVRFDGYEYLRAVVPDDAGTENQNDEKEESQK